MGKPTRRGESTESQNGKAKRRFLLRFSLFIASREAIVYD